MHMKVTDIGSKLGLIQVVADIGSEQWQDKVIDPDASFLPADVAPLLVLGCKRAIETRRDAIIELHFSAEFHGNGFGARVPLQS